MTASPSCLQRASSVLSTGAESTEKALRKHARSTDNWVMARTQTSMAFERLAGRMADGVAYGHRGGTALRSLPHYRYPLQPSQRESNERLKKANALFNTLDEREADLWTLHGERYKRRDPMSGALYAPPAKNLLVGFSCKLLQIDPDAVLPRLPPEGAFLGGSVGIKVEPYDAGSLPLEGPPKEATIDNHAESPLESPPRWRGRGGVVPGGESLTNDPSDSKESRGSPFERFAEGGTTPTQPSPKGEDSGGLLFTAERPTRPGVLIELMAQPLKNVRLKPGRFYKSRGFATFVEGGLTVLLPLPPGVYAVAVQSVERSSGRLAGFTTLGKVTVEAPPTPG